MNFPEKSVSTGAALVAATKDKNAQQIVVSGHLMDTPSVRLWPGQVLLAGDEDATNTFANGVTDVGLTQMHMDHCGGLLIDGVKDRVRPDLRIHVAAAELKFWESPDFSRV